MMPSCVRCPFRVRWRARVARLRHGLSCRDSPFTVWWLHKVRQLNTARRRGRGVAPLRQPLRSNSMRGFVNWSTG
eukprot:scaffold33784_cov60-Cyclotella_meneghiniana.AAC.4